MIIAGHTQTKIQQLAGGGDIIRDVYMFMHNDRSYTKCDEDKINYHRSEIDNFFDFESASDSC